MSELLNILIAYPYFTKRHVEKLKQERPRIPFNLIVDSGAFTAWNSDRTIELDDYCRFLDSIEHLRPFHAVQLDVFGDPKASYKNLLIMRSRGYNVMPVFTRGEDLEKLEEYYAMTDYIMFGGIVIGGQNKEYVKWWLGKNKSRKAHWLGFVNMDFIKHYRPESVDSSSWFSASRFGTMGFYDGIGNVKKIHKLEFINPPSKEQVTMFSRIGLNYDDLKILSDKNAWVCSGRIPNLEKGDLTSSAMFYTTMAEVFRTYEVRQKLGTKIYLAVGAQWGLTFLFEAVDRLINRGIIKP